PQSNSTQITATTTAVAERRRRTPAAPFNADSIGKVTSDSISVGTIPGPSISTVTVGAVRSGSTSTGILEMAYPPHKRKAAANASTMARLRRDQRMRPSIIFVVLLVHVPVCRNRTRHRRQTNQVCTLGDHAFTGAHTFYDLDVFALPISELHRAASERFARELDEHYGSARIIHHRCLSHRRSGFAGRSE